MKDFISDLYLALLSSPELTPTLQQQIFRFAKEKKDYELIRVLAECTYLDNSVDLEIGKISNLKVRAAWLSRPGRSAEELTLALSKYKSTTVLLELVNTECLPAFIYSTIVEKTDLKNVLLKVIDSEYVERPTRIRALERLSEIVVDMEGVVSAQVVGRYYMALQTLPEAAEEVAMVALAPSLLLAALNFGDLTHTAEKRSLGILTEHIAKLAGAMESGGHLHPIPFLTELSIVLNSKSGFSKEDMHGIVKNIEKLEKRVDKSNRESASKNKWLTGRQRNSYTEARILIEGAASKRKLPVGYAGVDGAKAFQENLSRCSGPEELSTIINLVLKITNSVDCNSKLISALSNKHITGNLLRSNVYKLSDSNLGVTLQKRLLDNGLWHIWLQCYPYQISDFEISKAADPQGVFRYLLTCSSKTGEWLGSSTAHVILTSRYMTDEMILLSPPTLFASGKTPPEIAFKVSALLESRLKSSDQWAIFEAMALDYHGCLGDLLDVVSTNS